MTEPRPAEPPRFLSAAEYQALFARLHHLGAQSVHLDSHWRSDVRWGRNRITMAGDWRNYAVDVYQSGPRAHTNATHPTALQAMVRWVDQVRQQFYGNPVIPLVHPPTIRDIRTFPATHIWSETTYAQTQDARLAIAEGLIENASTAGMLSAGYMSVEAQGYVLELPDGRVEYARLTLAECSLTVRDPSGSGSGWAGRSSYDWGRIGDAHLSAVALEKCLTSRNPVRIEPGRYTLIMEPQATFDLIKPLFYAVLGKHYDYLSLRSSVEGGMVPFADGKTTAVAVSRYGADYQRGATKLGQRVMDERITLRWDPLDPDLGRVPFQSGEGFLQGDVAPVRAVTWIANGVLTALGYPPGITEISRYGDRLDGLGVAGGDSSFRMEGGTTTIEEMIATTRRGLLVTRFSGIRVLDDPSILCTGTTRDGLWLIENGKVSHAVKNLRWTESPLFAFNQVEQIGAAVPIFNPGKPAMTPPVKVRDFNFTALEDAI